VTFCQEGQTEGIRMIVYFRYFRNSESGLKTNVVSLSSAFL
jgi:hypothetical protein